MELIVALLFYFCVSWLFMEVLLFIRELSVIHFAFSCELYTFVIVPHSFGEIHH